MHRASAALLLALLGCDSDPAEESPGELSAEEAIAKAEAVKASDPVDSEPVEKNELGRPAGPEAVGGADPVEVVLVWQGIGNLHRSWFSSGKAVTILNEGFAGRVEGPANVYVRHDNVNYIGSIRLQLRPDTLKVDVPVDGDVIELSALAPITQSLAAYRSHISGNYDLRIESFSVGIESIRGAHSCIFGVAGEPPPDGSLLSPCVEVDGAEVCGDTVGNGVRFPAETVSTLKTCLDLR